MPLNQLDRLRLERGAAHLHRLGARAIAELLAEAVESNSGGPFILARLAEYERGLTPAIICAAGGDRFPPRPVRVVPE